MKKLKNETLQKFLERLIETLEFEKEFRHKNMEKDNLDIPFIISSLYQSFKDNPSDYYEFISDLEKYPDYDFSIENSRKDYIGIADVIIYLCGEVIPDYDYLLSFTYDERDYGYCMCTPDMYGYREDKHCCGYRCDASFCEFSLQKISYIKRDSWNGNAHDYWEFEDEFYKSDEELAEKKREENKKRMIRKLKNRIEEDSKKLKELEGEYKKNTLIM